MAADVRFIDRSRKYLKANYLPKVEAAVRPLAHEDVWWRPNEASNAIGHLLLHLAGNVRQWIVGGVGDQAVARQRDLEFAPAGQPGASDLLAGLASAVDESDVVLAELDPATLETRTTVQGLDVTRLGVIYHVVEHFAMHTGQILWIAKARTGRDLGFYDLSGGKPRPTWAGTGESD
jgi:uncharacterized damage-inducible protein DinB